MARTYPKWPRTWHHPSSLSLQNDDRRLPDTRGFHNADGSPRICVYSEKMDGENTTLTRELTYPRSPDGRYHPSRDRLKAWHARFAQDIPDDWRISGESMTAVHAIEYSAANGNGPVEPFYAFGVWDGTNTMLSWDDTLEILEMLDIAPVPVLHIGPYDEARIAEIAASIDQERQEGFVIRVADAIPYPDDGSGFSPHLAKWVRAKHVQPGNSHWASGQWWPNELIQR